MWRKIREMRNLTNERVFPDLAELAERVLSLPHSNADSERIFSWISDVKTKKSGIGRRKKVLKPCWFTKSRLRTKDTVCYKYVPTDNQIKLHNSEYLYVATPPPGQEVESESEDEEDHWIWTAFFPSFFNVSVLKFWWWCKTLCFSNAANRFEKKDDLRKKTKNVEPNCEPRSFPWT